MFEVGFRNEVFGGTPNVPVVQAKWQHLHGDELFMSSSQQSYKSGLRRDEPQ